METFLGIDYNVWWFLVFGAVISGYAILDGFDLGAGAADVIASGKLPLPPWFNLAWWGFRTFMTTEQPEIQAEDEDEETSNDT